MTMSELLLHLSVLFLPTLTGALRIIPDFADSQKSGTTDFFLPGAMLTLKCESDLPNAVLNWTREQLPDPPTIQARGASGTELRLGPLRSDAGGRYQCSDGVHRESYQVNILHEDSVVPVNVLNNGTLHVVYVRCLQRFHPVFPLIWRRKEGGQWKILNDGVGEHQNFTVNKETNYTLEIRSHTGRFPLRTGEYECVLNTNGTGVKLREPIKRTVVYEATPDAKIDGVSDSRLAIEGDPFSLTCIYSGARDERVKWVIDASPRDSLLGIISGSSSGSSNSYAGWQTIIDYNDTFTPCPAEGHPDRQCLRTSNGQRYTLNRDRGAENASTQHERTSILEVKGAQYSDRGHYYCFVANEHGVNNATVFVRVKDRWAALWPFLGIVGEIILLGLIICLCERRRSRLPPYQEEEAKPLKAAEEQDRNTIPADNVRNRK